MRNIKSLLGILGFSVLTINVGAAVSSNDARVEAERKATIIYQLTEILENPSFPKNKYRPTIMYNEIKMEDPTIHALVVSIAQNPASSWWKYAVSKILHSGTSEARAVVTQLCLSIVSTDTLLRYNAATLLWKYHLEEDVKPIAVKALEDIANTPRHPKQAKALMSLMRQQPIEEQHEHRARLLSIMLDPEHPQKLSAALGCFKMHYYNPVLQVEEAIEVLREFLAHSPDHPKAPKIALWLSRSESPALKAAAAPVIRTIMSNPEHPWHVDIVNTTIDNGTPDNIRMAKDILWASLRDSKKDLFPCAVDHFFTYGTPDEQHLVKPLLIDLATGRQMRFATTGIMHLLCPRAPDDSNKEDIMKGLYSLLNSTAFLHKEKVDLLANANNMILAQCLQGVMLDYENFSVLRMFVIEALAQKGDKIAIKIKAVWDRRLPAILAWASDHFE